MKIHRTLVNAVTDTLKNIFEQGVYADKAVAQVLKQNAKWGARDRRFIAQTIYEMVRWWRLLNECSNKVFGNSNDYLLLFAIWFIENQKQLPEWEEFKHVDLKQIQDTLTELKKTRKYREAIPDWLDELAVAELGETVWEKEIQALNQEAKVVLRVNTLKTNASALKDKLQTIQVEVGVINTGEELWNGIKETALVVSKRQSIDKTKEYQDGLFEIQDAGSQLIATFLGAKPGITVIDACAGAGGKTLQIASIMGNKGNIIAMDVEDRKLKELKKRAERAGVTIVKTSIVNDNKIKELKDTADCLLLDVPCSGLGVLRRNPDAKWKLNLPFIEQVKQKQQHILSNYSQMLKPGGKLVYATCSILPSENQNQIQLFLKNNSGFKLLQDLTVYPSCGFDGFYMATLQKH
jgi:16S rRNA (cytosine967-C5)-methyltransferase